MTEMMKTTHERSTTLDWNYRLTTGISQLIGEGWAAKQTIYQNPITADAIEDDGRRTARLQLRNDRRVVEHE